MSASGIFIDPGCLLSANNNVLVKVEVEGEGSEEATAVESVDKRTTIIVPSNRSMTSETESNLIPEWLFDDSEVKLNYYDIQRSMNAADEYCDYLEHLAEKYKIDPDKIGGYLFLPPLTEITRF